MLSKRLAIFVGLLLLGSSVRADDAVITVGAGGLVPQDPGAIQIESEDLEITTRRITIHFIFRNPSDQDASPVVVFTLPDLNGMGLCTLPYALPRRNEVNYMGFGIISGAKPFPTQMEVRALRDATDVTERLKAAGVTPNVMQEPLNAALAKMAPEARDKLESEGLIEPHQFTLPLLTTNKRRGWCAQWSMRVRFFWTQPIAAHEAVELTQIYSPVVGGAYFQANNDERTYAPSYCATPEALGAIEEMKHRAVAEKDQAILFYEQAIEFALTSANYWNGPIGNFHLSVLTRDPNDMLMTCTPGLRNTAPGKYELEKSDFRPSDDLKLLILQKTRPFGW
jgi:uncharacterized protein DUF4424